jgi:hypothetical protein
LSSRSSAKLAVSVVIFCCLKQQNTTSRLQASKSKRARVPKVKISPKEIDQVMKYAREIEKLDASSSNIHYKILLISSKINSDAEFQIKGNQRSEDNPYFYFRNENKNIEIWVMKWSDLLENVKRKLKYMSNILNTKDIDVQEKAEKDFADIEFNKVSSSLKRVAIA